LDQVGEAAKVRYDIEFGALKNISEARKNQILSLANELDAQKEYSDILKEGDELAKKQRSGITETVKKAEELKKALADFTPPATGDFEARLYKIDDALKAGILSAKEAKIEFDKLGKLQVAGDFDQQKAQINKLSEFAIQGARNIETSLANALSSGFQGGLDGMLKSFIKFLADAAAQAAASKLLDLFVGGSKSAGSGVIGNVISGLFSSVAGARASGGSVNSGSTYLVGEKGPELFTPSNNGTILPAGSFGSQSGVSVGNVNISVTQNSNDSPDKTGQKIAESFIRALAKEEIMSANRPGNALNKVTSFG
jgi:hypothetical protein